MHSFTQKAIEIFSQQSDPIVGHQMSAYMKNNFPFIGIKSPNRKILISKVEASHTRLGPEEIMVVMDELWNLQEREYQYLGCEILIKNCKKQPKEFIEKYEYYILNKSWWDSIDYFVPKALAMHFSMYPELIKPYTQKWINSENIWLQRAAVLFQLKHKKQTDLALLYNIIGQLSDSKEFFVQKAIGWILREYSKIDPQEIERYVDTQPLKPLSRREALKIIYKSKKRK